MTARGLNPFQATATYELLVKVRMKCLWITASVSVEGFKGVNDMGRGEELETASPAIPCGNVNYYYCVSKLAECQSVPKNNVHVDLVEVAPVFLDQFSFG